MGLPRPPAFLEPSLDADTILNLGVSYASGGGGILNETSSLFIQRFSLSKQIELFQGTQEMIKMKIGEAAATKFFLEAHYVVCMGSNDYINNFLLPVYADSWTYNGETFTNYVINTLDGQLRLLYSLGARQLTFFGLGPMGCIPLQRFLTLSGDCQESTNKLALMFNNKSMTVLQTLSKTLPNATYQFGDAYNIFQDLINRPEIYDKANELIANAVVAKLGLAKPSNGTHNS